MIVRKGQRVGSKIYDFWRRALAPFFLPAFVAGFAIGLLVCTVAYLVTQPDAGIAQDKIETIAGISLIVCPASLSLMGPEGLGPLGFFIEVIIIAILNAFLYGLGGLVLAGLVALGRRRSAQV